MDMFSICLKCSESVLKGMLLEDDTTLQENTESDLRPENSDIVHS